MPRHRPFPWPFFLLTFAITWVLWIPVALAGVDPTSQPLTMLGYLLGGFGPSLAGIVLTYRGSGREERREFWRRVTSFRRISARWYPFIFLIYPAVLFLAKLAVGAVQGTTPRFETLADIAAQPPLLAGIALSTLVAGPLSEELGWRGYALDRLQAGYGVFAAGLILGVIWWAWHLPLFFMPGTAHYGWGLLSLASLSFGVGAIALTFLLSALYNQNRRSILAAILFHFVVNFSATLLHPMPEMALLLANGLLLGIGAALLSRRASRAADQPIASGV